MKNKFLNILFLINIIVLVANILLFIAPILGMLFTMVLGAVQYISSWLLITTSCKMSRPLRLAHRIHLGLATSVLLYITFLTYVDYGDYEVITVIVGCITVLLGLSFVPLLHRMRNDESLNTLS